MNTAVFGNFPVELNRKYEDAFMEIVKSPFLVDGIDGEYNLYWNSDCNTDVKEVVSELNRIAREMGEFDDADFSYLNGGYFDIVGDDLDDAGRVKIVNGKPVSVKLKVIEE